MDLPFAFLYEEEPPHGVCEDEGVYPSYDDFPPV